MKLSIIIPVYRVEDTLDRCMESVISQDYHDMEIIVVDDGSPDRCPQMCDEWAQKDARISVIHQENGGLSDARNSGIAKATGDYITFVDSDDFIAPDTFPALMDIICKHPEYDILEYSCTTMPLTDAVYTDMNDYWLNGEAYQHAYAWNKIYKRALFKDIRFPKGKVFEDMYTLPYLLDLSNVVATTAQGMYHYSPTGISKNTSCKAIAQLLDAQTIVLEKFKGKDDASIRKFYLQVLNTQMETYGKGGPIVLRNYWDTIKTSPTYTWKCNIKVIMYNILGIKRLCQIYKILNQYMLHRW